MIAAGLTPDQAKWLAKFGYNEHDEVTLRDAQRTVMAASLVCEVKSALQRMQQDDRSLFLRLGIATDGDDRMPGDQNEVLESDYNLVRVDTKSNERIWQPGKLAIIQALLTVNDEGDVTFANLPLCPKADRGN